MRLTMGPRRGKIVYDICPNATIKLSNSTAWGKLLVTQAAQKDYPLLQSLDFDRVDIPLREASRVDATNVDYQAFIIIVGVNELPANTPERQFTKLPSRLVVHKRIAYLALANVIPVKTLADQSDFAKAAMVQTYDDSYRVLHNNRNLPRDFSQIAATELAIDVHQALSFDLIELQTSAAYAAEYSHQHAVRVDK